jgi:hypothetical protein
MCHAQHEAAMGEHPASPERVEAWITNRGYHPPHFPATQVHRLLRPVV